MNHFIMWPADFIILSTLSHKLHDLKKNTLLNIKCAFGFSLQLSFETSLILKIIEQDMIKKCILVRFE